MFVRPKRKSTEDRIPKGLDPIVVEILRDPLDKGEIERLAEFAEHPELCDPIIALLPEQKWGFRTELIFHKQLVAELKERSAQEKRAHAIQENGQPTLVAWLV